jgi:hypothetical protein
VNGAGGETRLAIFFHDVGCRSTKPFNAQMVEKVRRGR